MSDLVVIEVDGRTLGRVKKYTSWDQAIDFATSLVKEQCDEDEATIKEALANDHDYWWGTGEDGFQVYIGEAES